MIRASSAQFIIPLFARCLTTFFALNSLRSGNSSGFVILTYTGITRSPFSG